MYGYIYKTTNLINNKIYIGKKVSKKFANYYKGSGKLIKAAILKYGEENFICELLESCETNEELNDREKFYIKLYNSRDKSIGYNISSGGDGGDIFHDLSEEHKIEIKQKMSKTSKDRIWITNGNKTKFVKPEQLQEYLENGFKIGYSEDRIRKMSESHKNNPQPLNSGCWKLGQEAWNKGVPCPEEKKQKIRETLTGMKQSKETSDKRSRSMKEKYKNGYISPMKGKEPWNKGMKMVWVANDIKTCQIPLDKLQEYLNNGYHKGRRKY